MFFMKKVPQQNVELLGGLFSFIKGFLQKHLELLGCLFSFIKGPT